MFICNNKPNVDKIDQIRRIMHVIWHPWTFYSKTSRNPGYLPGRRLELAPDFGPGSPTAGDALSLATTSGTPSGARVKAVEPASAGAWCPAQMQRA
jgi:hypothetical protein